MPKEGVSWRPHETVLQYEEIAQIVRVAAQAGITEVRLTGGEPLVRKGLPDLVRMLSEIPGIEDISLTTNGLLLEQFARPLVQAGLKRLNISMDTLKPERFEKITRGGSFTRLWNGIHLSEDLGLTPLKFNTVVMRGVNDDEVLDIAKLSIGHPWHMRFIELMPIMNQTTWGEGFPPVQETYFSIQNMLEMLAPLGLQPEEQRFGSGPARTYRIPGALGTVGFISPLGESFCEGCNRLRLTSDGNLRPCLLSEVEVPLLPALRAGEPILPYLEKAIELKPVGHELQDHKAPAGRCMMQIGG
jgi:cyclic pyranopterin phosphate synthase